jgi:hypothetical protein
VDGVEVGFVKDSLAVGEGEGGGTFEFAFGGLIVRLGW